MGTLESLANRGYTDGFFVRHHSQELQQYHHGASHTQRQIFVGEVSGPVNQNGMALVDVKNKIRVGDSLELLTPVGNVRFELDTLFDEHGVAMAEAPGGGYRVWMPLPVPHGDYGLIARDVEGERLKAKG